MRCKLNKPSACFNCPYPDCIDVSCNTTWEEKEALNCSWIDSAAHKIRASLTNNRHKPLTPEQRARKYEKSREWNRIHQKEQQEKRRDYFREYQRRYRAEKKELIECLT